MEPLPHVPRNFQELVEADLRRAARLVIRIQDEIDWQFRFATRDGDYHLSVMMPDDQGERRAMLRRVETLFQWKQAAAFAVAAEIYEPDAVYCVGVSRSERVVCLSRIRREPKPWTAANFGAVEWLPEASIDPVLIALLPDAPRPMTPKEISALDKWFGVSGKFPLLHVSCSYL